MIQAGILPMHVLILVIIWHGEPGNLSRMLPLKLLGSSIVMPCIEGVIARVATLLFHVMLKDVTSLLFLADHDLS